MKSVDSSRVSLAIPLALSLRVASGVAYRVMWSVLRGLDGCGPPGHSTSGRIFSAAPFAFPLLAAIALGIVGTKLRWRRRTHVVAIVATVGLGAIAEIVVFLAEFTAHRCGE